MDFSAFVAPERIHTLEQSSGGFDAARLGGAGLSGSGVTWPAANEAFFVPVTIPFPFSVRRCFWLNGSSVTSTNRDFGIYNADGTKLASTGATAASGTSVIQFVSLTVFLTPGRYYFALSTDTATANRGAQGLNAPAVKALRLAGVLEQATAHPLPSTMASATTVTNTTLPLIGVTSTSSGV